MGIREDMAFARAKRAHMLDMISMEDQDTECLECKAKQMATVLMFTAAMGCVALVAYRIGKRNNRG